jgi:fluoride ion exporter CrcB/FEX
MNESVVLFHDGQFLWGGLNLAGQVVTGFIAFWIAFALTSIT